MSLLYNQSSIAIWPVDVAPYVQHMELCSSDLLMDIYIGQKSFGQKCGREGRDKSQNRRGRRCKKRCYRKGQKKVEVIDDFACTTGKIFSFGTKESF